MQPPTLYHEERPWGEFVELARNTPVTVKIITVHSGEALSLQQHAKRDELWRVLSGNGTITSGTEQVPAVIGSMHFIPRSSLHRLEAGSEPLVVLEIAYGTFDDTDIIRLEDRYGRV